jgi:type I restriction enzyme, S subunit
MSNKATTLLFPKLRFPEFQGGPPWESRELGPMTLKVGSGITPTGGDKNYKATGRPFVRSQNVGWGVLILDDVAYIDEEMHRSFDSTEIVTSDVLLNITGASIGRSAVADSRVAAGNVNQHVCIIRAKPNELNPFLLNQYLISQNGQRQIDSFQAGGNRQGLNFSQIRSFLIPLSQALSEQQKIADCLSSLDELIAAQACKVDALKNHKKGLMQQLFPHEGETQPRLRFPEFRNAAEWTPTALGSIASFSSGGTPSKDNPDYWNGSIPWVSASSMYELHISRADHYVTPLAIGNGTRIAKKGTLLILVRGSMLFKRVPMCIAAVDVAFNQDVKALKVDPSVDGTFLIYQLLTNEDRIPINETGIGAGKIELADLKEFGLFISSRLEQRRIADCLSNLDDLIIAATQEFESLKIQKKGLIQQLFPSVEVDA